MKEKTAIGTAIQAALVSTLNGPEADRYQLFSEFDDDNSQHSGAFLGMEYAAQLLMVEITFLEGRDDELKKAFLAQMNKNLVDAGLVRPEDVYVMITEAGLANVSFGQGLAQRAESGHLTPFRHSGLSAPSNGQRDRCDPCRAVGFRRVTG